MTLTCCERDIAKDSEIRGERILYGSCNSVALLTILPRQYFLYVFM